MRAEPSYVGRLLRKALTPRAPIGPRAYGLLAALTFAIFLGVWSLLSYGGFVEPFFLPSPSKVVASIVELFAEHDLASHIGASTFRVVAGFLLSAALAVPLGILIGTYKVAEALAEPLNDFIRYMPVVAFIPLCILWIGIGDSEKIAIIFIGTFFQLVLLVADVVSGVRDELLETAYTLGLSKWQVLVRVLVPASWPGVFDSLRICMGWAWSYLVVAELVAASRGIGFMIIQSQRFLKTSNVISGILIVGLLGVGFDFMFKLAYRVLFPWTEKGIR